MPLKALQCETGLAPLPIHLSWRVEPSSIAQKTLVDSVLVQLGIDPTHRKYR
jgi:hypothetical protein